MFLIVFGESVLDFAFLSKVNTNLLCQYIENEVKFFTGSPRKTQVPNTERLRRTATQKEGFTETRHLHNRLGCKKIRTGNLNSRRVILDKSKKRNKFRGNDERTSMNSKTQSKLMKTKRCCMYSKLFQSIELKKTSQWLRITRRNYGTRCAPKNQKVIKEQKSNFRTLLIEISNNWTKSLADEMNKAKFKTSVRRWVNFSKPI